MFEALFSEAETCQRAQTALGAKLALGRLTSRKSGSEAGGGGGHSEAAESLPVRAYVVLAARSCSQGGGSKGRVPQPTLASDVVALRSSWIAPTYLSDESPTNWPYQIWGFCKLYRQL